MKNVIKCSECKYAIQYEGAEVLFCGNTDGLSTWVGDDNFCSSAELFAITVPAPQKRKVGEGWFGLPENIDFSALYKGDTWLDVNPVVGYLIDDGDVKYICSIRSGDECTVWPVVPDSVEFLCSVASLEELFELTENGEGGGEDA